MAIGEFILGIVMGCFTAVAANRLLSKAPMRWIQRFLKPRPGKVDHGYLERLATALTARLHPSLLLPLGPVIAVAVLVLAPLPVELVTGYPLSIYLPLGCFVAILGSYPFLMHQQIREYRHRVAATAARQLVRRIKPHDAAPVLIAASSHHDPKVRLAAVQGLRELGTEAGNLALTTLSEDPDSKVAEQARDALGELMQVLKGASVLSVRTMDTYVREHRFLENQVLSRNPAVARNAVEKLHEITLQIEEVVYSQLILRRAYPDLFCAHCFSRAEDLHYEEWEWVRCKQCKEVHGLAIGARQVIGQIGGDHDWVMENGQVRVNLWDESLHRARYGEVDVLEVVGGKPLNYNWAISAVIEKMHNLHPVAEFRVKVRLVGNPLLEVNTLHLLRTLDPSVMGAST